MIRTLLAALMLTTAASPAAVAAETAPFQCKLRETEAFLPELQTYSGYRWIECVVVGPEVAEVENAAVNNGRCQSFDYWYAGRSFVRGQSIVIPYACMSPLTVTIAANGVLSQMRLR